MNKKKIKALSEENAMLRVKLSKQNYWLNHAFYFILSHGYLKEYSDFKEEYRGMDPHADSVQYIICTLYPEYQKTRNRNRLSYLPLLMVEAICRRFNIH